MKWDVKKTQQFIKKNWFIFFAFSLFILFIFFTHLFSDIWREGFTKKSQNDFLKIQHTINPNKVFDMEMIQEQASQKELDYFNKNGYWPWSQKVIDLYKEAVTRNPYVRTEPELAVKQARTVYNEASILRVLSYQTKEGQFLINGVIINDPSGNKLEEEKSGFGFFPYEAGLLDERKDEIIKCKLRTDATPTLERIRYIGKGGIYNQSNEKNITPVDYHQLEVIIPGFTFLDKPCNPCGALAPIPNYSCPFRLQVENKPPFVSNVWQYLWNINDNPLQSTPSFLTETIDNKKFPLLSELQKNNYILL